MTSLSIKSINLPIRFDPTHEVQWKEKISLAARLALQIGISRDEFEDLVYFTNKDISDWALSRYDFLVEEKKRNHERNAKLKVNQTLNDKKDKNDKKVIRAYDRLAKVDLETVFNNLGKSIRVEGHSIPIKSKRYHCYASKGIICVRCGIVGNYFAAEKSISQATDKYHLNLYHLGEDGKETMMTVDHRQALSCGGPDNVSNLQPMCIRCNELKGNMSDEEFKKLPLV